MKNAQTKAQVEKLEQQKEALNKVQADMAEAKKAIDNDPDLQAVFSDPDKFVCYEDNGESF